MARLSSKSAPLSNALLINSASPTTNAAGTKPLPPHAAAVDAPPAQPPTLRANAWVTSDCVAVALPCSSNSAERRAVSTASAPVANKPPERTKVLADALPSSISMDAAPL
ncbi:hypothetical protein B7L65_10455 [Xanthomonas citri pv. citri]|nr:hypothetical protein B7L65_10455 [Xanthomonas citri pv. citri]